MQTFMIILLKKATFRISWWKTDTFGTLVKKKGVAGEKAQLFYFNEKNSEKSRSIFNSRKTVGTVLRILDCILLLRSVVNSKMNLFQTSLFSIECRIYMSRNKCCSCTHTHDRIE